MWTYWVCDTVTGERITQLPLASCSWSTRMNDQVGSGQSTLLAGASDFDAYGAPDWLDVTRPWARTLAVCWDETPVYAGVLKSPSYRLGDRLMTLRHAEVGELLRRRLFFGAGEYWGTGLASFTNLSRQGMLVEVAKLAAGGGYDVVPAGNAPWRLPIHFPAAGSGSWSKDTFQHMFERPSDWLSDIVEESGGPDFSFEAGFGTGAGTDGLQWVFNAGTPLLNRSTHEFHVGAPESPVTDVEITLDADEMQTGVFVSGEGMDEDILVGMSTSSPSLVTPAMDLQVAAKHVSSVAQLDSMAQGMQDRLGKPVPVWSFKVRADVVLAAMHGGAGDGLRPGSRVRLLSQGDPVLDAWGVGGVSEFYVTGMSGDMSEMVSLEVQSL